MSDHIDDELQQALAPLTSLLSKSEKAQQRLAPGTWQHAMLGRNTAALRIAIALLAEPAAHDHPRDELEAALDAIADMIRRTESAGTKFAPGTSQHSLQRNRLAALCTAEGAVHAALGAR